jgi:glycosyltransferase involved in cell wall biosynthesis
VTGLAHPEQVVPDRDAARSLRCVAIVPAFNEAASIAAVVHDLRTLEIDVIAIDDGSTDATAEIARAAGARVVRLPFNLGIGGAVQTGYLAARDGGYDVAIQVDGDGQHPPGQIPALLAALTGSGLDLVIGSRFLSDDGYRSSAARRAGIGMFARIVSAIVRERVTDPTSGFRAAGRRAIGLFAEAYPHDYPEVEAIVIASRAGLRLGEAHVEMRERQGGRSSITPLRSAYYMVKVLLATLMQVMRQPARLPEP